MSEKTDKNRSAIERTIDTAASEVSKSHDINGIAIVIVRNDGTAKLHSTGRNVVFLAGALSDAQFQMLRSSSSEKEKDHDD